MTGPGATTNSVDDGAWAAVLAEFEHQLALFDAAMVGPEAGVLQLPAWEPPGDIGPIPTELAPRARSVLERLRHASERAGARLDALQGQREEVGLRRRAGNAYAAASR